MLIKLTLLLSSVEAVNAAGIDKTLQPDQTGCEVAKAALDKVENSKIFKDDNFFLTRLSVVSNFGNDVFLAGTLGIWQMNDANLRKAKQVSKQQQLSDKIKKILCIDFDSAKEQDLKKPLYNLVCAALLIQVGPNLFQN